MFDQHVIDSSDFPIADKNRRSTDVCCTVLTAIFALTLFVLAIVFWNPGNFQKLTSFTDSNENICEKLVFYPNINDPNVRQCVNSCPDTTYIYGKQCLPNDQTAKNKLLNNPKVSAPWKCPNFMVVLLCTALIALGVGLAWMVFTHCLPLIAPIVAYLLSIICLLALIVIFLVIGGGSLFWSGLTPLKISVAVFCLILAVILIVMLVCYNNEIKFQALFLDYSRKYINHHPSTIAYLFLFLIFAAGLICLIGWQQICFFSAFSGSNQNIWGKVLTILNAIQFIWGLQFLRDAFNFCVAGGAVDWYWNLHGQRNCYSPFQRLICNHWGSVAGGSFLNAFFEIPTLLVQLIVCHPESCCSRIGSICQNQFYCCTSYFNIVRTDAYSYMNLSGIPFCNSARQCEKICHRSHHFIGIHSPMKHYRFVAHILCVSLSFLICYFILRQKDYDFQIWQLVSLVVLIFICVTFFIGIHVDSAQGLQTSFLVQHDLENDYQYIDKCLPSIRKQLQLYDNRKIMDGNIC